ncbi:hypothetical protein PRIPAC_70065 [Pristionchus pacificus]|uniref:Uncharacterized protein n=1 Tax=Pristionchus pacificus TaxID=54126 RepID=A0A2A6BF24_PRIPA|nr:hypothetical protein PRIPAC_70065 [Pristionchus pacificus]|eukprot:PDM64468.1 hypothetical protein PRIPAC_52724 [Pristionchus pacificus]
MSVLFDRLRSIATLLRNSTADEGIFYIFRLCCYPHPLVTRRPLQTRQPPAPAPDVVVTRTRGLRSRPRVLTRTRKISSGKRGGCCCVLPCTSASPASTASAPAADDATARRRTPRPDDGKSSVREADATSSASEAVADEADEDSSAASRAASARRRRRGESGGISKIMKWIVCDCAKSDLGDK